MNSHLRSPLALVLLLVASVVLAAIGTASLPGSTAAAPNKSCMKFSGPVLMTYTNPETIIIHIIKGKVNAATVFTMSPTTTYKRNGSTATFADIKTGDNATICAVEQLPSGVLLATWVEVTGP